MTTFQTIMNDSKPTDLLVNRKTGEVRSLTDSGRAYVRDESPKWIDLKLATESERFFHAVAVANVARRSFNLRVAFDDGEPAARELPRG